jgi:hydrogenase maturation protease
VSAIERGAIIVGIGQPTAGDDGVGLLVARTLAMRGVPALESTDATVLLSLLGEKRSVVVVDAVVGGGDAGAVLHLRPEALAEGPKPVSSHGLGVVEMLTLACTLHGADVVRRVEIVGVVIDGAPRFGDGLSPAVAAAVVPAAALAERLAIRRA